VEAKGSISHTLVSAVHLDEIESRFRKDTVRQPQDHTMNREAVSEEKAGRVSPYNAPRFFPCCTRQEQHIDGYRHVTEAIGQLDNDAEHTLIVRVCLRPNGIADPAEVNDLVSSVRNMTAQENGSGNGDHEVGHGLSFARCVEVYHGASRSVNARARQYSDPTRIMTVK
jgi:hypothetical protein